MRILGIAWLGLATERYAEMAHLFRDVLSLHVDFEDRDTIEVSFGRFGRVQLFAPGNRFYSFLRRNARGFVPLFEVDDVRSARRELEAAGLTVVGPMERDAAWEWINVQGPDGSLLEFASRRS